MVPFLIPALQPPPPPPSLSFVLGGSGIYGREGTALILLILFGILVQITSVIWPFFWGGGGETIRISMFSSAPVIATHAADSAELATTGRDAHVRTWPYKWTSDVRIAGY